MSPPPLVARAQISSVTAARAAKQAVERRRLEHQWRLVGLTGYQDNYVRATTTSRLASWS